MSMMEPLQPSLGGRATSLSQALPWVGTRLRSRVEKWVAGLDPHPLTLEFDLDPDPAGPEVATVVRRFHANLEHLRAASIAPWVAIYNDSETGASLPVPVVVEEGPGFLDTYLQTVADLSHGGLPMEARETSAVREIFIDRLSEFIGTPQRLGSVAAQDTIVNTRRSGDPVFYCLGYFASTATNFGTSTPATVSLPPGRYTFGIVDGGRKRFGASVWSCPNPNVTEALP